MRDFKTDEQTVINDAVDILTNNKFFDQPIEVEKHWRVALALDDVHFGCCLFIDEESKNQFLNHYQQLVKTTGRKWGCAVIECAKE